MNKRKVSSDLGPSRYVLTSEVLTEQGLEKAISIGGLLASFSVTILAISWTCWGADDPRHITIEESFGLIKRKHPMDLRLDPWHFTCCRHASSLVSPRRTNIFQQRAEGGASSGLLLSLLPRWTVICPFQRLKKAASSRPTKVVRFFILVFFKF